MRNPRTHPPRRKSGAHQMTRRRHSRRMAAHGLLMDRRSTLSSGGSGGIRRRARRRGRVMLRSAWVDRDEVLSSVPVSVVCVLISFEDVNKMGRKRRSKSRRRRGKGEGRVKRRRAKDDTSRLLTATSLSFLFYLSSQPKKRPSFFLSECSLPFFFPPVYSFFFQFLLAQNSE